MVEDQGAAEEVVMMDLDEEEEVQETVQVIGDEVQEAAEQLISMASPRSQIQSFVSPTGQPLPVSNISTNSCSKIFVYFNNYYLYKCLYNSLQLDPVFETVFAQIPIQQQVSQPQVTQTQTPAPQVPTPSQSQVAQTHAPTRPQPQVPSQSEQQAPTFVQQVRNDYFV